MSSEDSNNKLVPVVTHQKAKEGDVVVELRRVQNIFFERKKELEDIEQELNENEEKLNELCLWSSIQGFASGQSSHFVEVENIKSAIRSKLQILQGKKDETLASLLRAEAWLDSIQSELKDLHASRKMVERLQGRRSTLQQVVSEAEEESRTQDTFTGYRKRNEGDT
jgi:hypothetical protein